MKTIFIILIFIGINKLGLCQSTEKQLNPIFIPNLDTTFRAIVKNHLTDLEVNGHFDPIDTFVVIYILPNISTSDGVPQRIIDSIYCNNIFPLTATSNNYRLTVMSLSFGCRAFNGLLSFKYQYCSRFQDRIVLIVSDLKIEFLNTNERISIIVCTSNPCKSTCFSDLSKSTSYILNDDELVQTKYYDVWLRSNHLINHPRK